MLANTYQRFSAVDMNGGLFWFGFGGGGFVGGGGLWFFVHWVVYFSSPPAVYQTRNICKTVHNLPTYSGLYIESYFWFCQKCIHRCKDIAIHHCTNVHLTCLAAKHQNSVSILFNVSVLTQMKTILHCIS